MASFTDWLARTFYTSSDYEQTTDQVKAAQQSELNQQIASGKVDAISAMGTQALINDTGTSYLDSQLGKSGAAGLPGLAFSYWWIFAIIGLIVFINLGGLPWLIRTLRKK